MSSANISTPYVVPNFVALWLAHRRARRQASDGKLELILNWHPFSRQVSRFVTVRMTDCINPKL